MKTFFLSCVAVAAAAGVSSQAFAANIAETAIKAGQFNTLVAALKAGDLVDTLTQPGPFTVFAPTDEAFANLPEGTVESLLKPENQSKLAGILTYHVVPGRVAAADVTQLTGATTVNGQRIDIQVSDRSVMVDQATVTATDIVCDNGIIHVIDAVLLPADKNLPETASASGTFSTLLAAAQAAGLAKAIGANDTFTVFAPTDEAFAKLPEGTVSSLLKPENKSQLADILKYHVVSGRVYSDAALKAGTAKTLEGSSIRIAVKDSVAMVNDSRLVTTDIDASNGVIHVVDSVLMPPKPAQPHSSVSQTSQSSVSHSVSPRQQLHNAVAQGVPLFNAGHHAACADIYEQALTNLMHSTDRPEWRHKMQMVVSSAGHQSNPASRAWTLRHGIDEMVALMSHSR